MAESLFILLVTFVLLFGLVIFRGAPYLPTLRQQQKMAIDMLDLKKGQTLLELGSGDGRMLAYAAGRGIRSVGYELNPLLVVWTKLRYIRYRKLIDVRWGDFWLVDWPPSDGMYVFLLDRYMEKLDKKITHYSRGKKYKVVSYTFKIPDKKPKKIEKALYLYTY